MRPLFLLFFLSTNVYSQLRVVVPRDSALSSYTLREGELVTGDDNKTLYIHANSAVEQVSSPSGVILAFGGTSAPAGYLLCDGSAVSRETYANLFSAIGTAFGPGNGSTTFNLPDLRGRFMRGVDGGSGRDPNAGTRSASVSGGNTGDNVGSAQDDSARYSRWTGYNFNSGSASDPVSISSSGNTAIMITSGAAVSSIITTTIENDETRPKNINVNYIIKI